MEYDLTRFLTAHALDYQSALSELRRGRKVSHWMWYIFPQCRGLGYSSTSRRYAIRSLEEAEAYLAHPVLGQHMRELCETLLSLDTNDAEAVFGPIDAAKLRSSMTLFRLADPQDDIFERVLQKFFDGREDDRTLDILGL